MRRHLWRAPAEDGGILVDPPLPEIEAALAQNRKQFAHTDVAIHGVPLQELRAGLRAEIAARALSLYAPLLQQPSPAGDVPWILTGHQPELFHPGVWLKNFAANGVARRVGGMALHLLVDTDTARQESIRLPVASDDAASVRTEFVPIDRASGEPPIELWRCRDEQLFDSVPSAASTLTKLWAFEPLLDRFWSDAQAFRSARPGGEYLGMRFAFARRKLESAWGCANVDLPQSFLCRTRAFAYFLAVLLSEPRRFHETYNRFIEEYRREHRVRSRNHPAPTLQHHGDWFELPLWIRHSNDVRRARLFVRDRVTAVELRAGLSGADVVLSREPDAIFNFITTSHWHVRTRALTTTLFARLFLADLFIHGIGGAKYDEVTDDILFDFFGMPAPAYAVVTGTLHLPLPRFPAIRTNHHQLQRWLRDLDWNPEKFIDSPDAATSDLIAAKRALRSATPVLPEERKQRFRSLQDLTRGLRPAVAEKRAQIEKLLEHCDAQLAANAILTRRDYPFVLYPEEKLRQFCTQLL